MQPTYVITHNGDELDGFYLTKEAAFDDAYDLVLDGLSGLRIEARWPKAVLARWSKNRRNKRDQALRSAGIDPVSRKQF